VHFTESDFDACCSKAKGANRILATTDLPVVIVKKRPSRQLGIESTGPHRQKNRESFREILQSGRNLQRTPQLQFRSLSREHEADRCFQGRWPRRDRPKPLLDQSSERMSAPISPPDGNSCSMLMAELHVFVCPIGPLQRRNGWMQMGHRREDLHRTRT
jgi:hypothetical protein